MIDRMFVPTLVHIVVGMAVLGLTGATTLLTTWQAWRGRSAGRWMHGALIVTQVVLMAQVLIGVKLLDQGSGAAQLYIHYVGGLAPLFFFMLWYWIAPRESARARWGLAAVTAASFLFALMTYTIGQGYVRGTL
ncbi:MAG: hypothetical protein KGS47_01590 [Chloroflexi bacterium]|nr:hypothetical protein [Chloroflexota bacterium]